MLTTTKILTKTLFYFMKSFLPKISGVAYVFLINGVHVGL